jgi:oxygen-independent coproporphyrinogen-3 oxidase
MCDFETEFKGEHDQFEVIKNRLGELEEDGLVTIDENHVFVTEKGIPFVRNICMAFDLKMDLEQPKERMFSKTV